MRLTANVIVIVVVVLAAAAKDDVAVAGEGWKKVTPRLRESERVVPKRCLGRICGYPSWALL